MEIADLIQTARQQGASDLHLEPSLPPALRIRGALRISGDPVPAQVLLEMSREIIGEEQWPLFVERRSFDLSKTIRGVRCRINVMHTSRGVGMAIRLLSSCQTTLEKLNLHPDLKNFVTHPHGLVLISGATGSGKSSTLAALIQEINVTEARHILTVESPIEYAFRPQRSYIRQREVGRDTPSFDQALIDALREDPDVLMVGEMRDPETMRLTLNASETGHLVFATVHSASAVEALQRVVSAFPSEIQSAVSAQLADCLVGVICQRLRFRPDLQMRIPECEILVSTHPIKNFIRKGEFFKIMSCLETGSDSGMWTFARYQRWLDQRKTWHAPGTADEADLEPLPEVKPLTLPAMERSGKSLPPSGGSPVSPGKTASAQPAAGPTGPGKGRIEIQPHEGGLDDLLKRL